MTIGIYKITNPNNKVYIGSSKNIEKRWKSYKWLNCKNQTALIRSFKKYGVSQHQFKILIECNVEELYEWEHHYSNYYDSIKKGLNCRIPGFNEIKSIVSQETRLKIGLKSKGRIPSKETREKISNGNLGKKMPLEWVARISKIHTGLKRSDETRKKMSIAQTGIKHSKERIEKTTLARIGFKHSAENRAKRSEFLLGKGGKLILNVQTGIFYDTVTEAAKIHSITRSSLTYNLIHKNPIYKHLCYV